MHALGLGYWLIWDFFPRELDGCAPQFCFVARPVLVTHRVADEGRELMSGAFLGLEVGLGSYSPYAMNNHAGEDPVCSSGEISFLITIWLLFSS